MPIKSVKLDGCNVAAIITKTTRYHERGTKIFKSTLVKHLLSWRMKIPYNSKEKFSIIFTKVIMRSLSPKKQ